MSGHSKWSKIKRKKGALDSKRGKEFSKLIKVMTAATREGGSDPDQNIRLKAAVDKAKEINMPQDTIARAIKRGSGDTDGAQYEEMIYEGYGPGGVAVIIETLSDNKNRTSADVRHALTKFGGSLGTTGCVQWKFEKKGIIEIPSEGIEEDKIMEVAIEAGADEVTEADGYFTVTCQPVEFETLKKALAEAGFTIEESNISMEPQATVTVDKKNAASVLKMMNLLEDLDDVQDVYSDFDIPEEIMDELED